MSSRKKKVKTKVYVSNITKNNNDHAFFLYVSKKLINYNMNCFCMYMFLIVVSIIPVVCEISRGW